MKKSILFLCFALLISTVNFAQVPQSERNALIDFYNVTDGANWNDNTNWNTTDPVSSWFGVTTQIINSVEHVTGISLSDNNLQPNIPSSIGNLTELVEFFVVNTARLFGSANSIPVEIGNLSNLQVFWIEHWNLQGSIPSSFGNLNALTTLIISNTNMDGVIPSSLNTLPVLDSFAINDNNFSGTIPDFTSSLINLFRIQNNNFQFGDFENEFATYLANIAAFTYSPQKELTVSPKNFLVAVGNNLTLNSAPISGSANLYQWYLNGSPVAGGTSVNLDLINIQNTEFGTYNCFVTNTIVSSLSILTATIQVSQDPLTHPDYPALLALYNATNGANWKDNTNWLDINQPLSTWFGIREENGRVTGINLGSNNNVIGTLPPEITTLTELKTFFIRSANLTGEIPNNIGDLANLTQLSLIYTTGLTGNIPTSLLNASNLILLDLAGNELEGTIPDFTSFYLASFYIDNNKFQFGDFENEFTTYQSTVSYFRYKPQKRTSIDQSQIVSIGDNVFFDAIVSGNNNIYQWYHNNVLMAGEVSSTLTLNNIQTSQFGTYRCDITNSIVTGLTLQTGNFNIGGNPETNPDYPALVAFYNATNGDNWKNNTNWLDINQPLASWFGITETNGRVTDINLNRNFLIGTLPPEIGDLSELKTFNIINALQRDLPPEFFNLTKLENLNLSANGIGYESSNLLTQMGNLINLINLDLGFNGFSGNIPTEISNLTNLQTLILHHNRFEGTIPSSFTALTNLQSLILSNNNLSGVIPDLSSVSTLSNFDIQKNNLVFSDLEPNFSALTTLPSFVYSPQKKVGDVHGLAGNVGDTITLETVPGLGTGLTIDWYRIDELGNFTFISSGLTLDVTINTASDYGDYAYLVISTIVTGLILESNKIILGPNPATHPDYNDLIALYNATNGDNWTKPWDITAPIHYWNIPPTSFHPAKLTFNPVTDRVDIINLSRNNLTGTLPPEVGNMTSLTRFQVFANDLTGEVPSEIWNLVNLEYLWLGFQSSEQLLLTGGIPPEISNMTNLFWLNLTWIPLTLPLQPELFNLPNLERLRMVNCGLTGVLPVGLGTIDNVLLGDNNFEGAIPADILNSTGNSRLSLRNNYFDFSDLEPLVLADNYTTLFYTPQRTKDVAQTVNETPGNDIVLSVDDTDISRAAKTKAVNNEYQWFKDNVAIAGANASTYTIFNAQPTDSGVYFCEITNPLLPGLVIRRADITVNVGTLGIEDDELNTLKIYPNPTKDFLTILFNNIENNGSIRMYDIRGRLVLEQKLKSDSFILDMTQFQNGMYILNIKADNRNVVKKIIKQ